MKDHSQLFRWTLLAASLLTIAFLAASAVSENFFGHWYLVQREYRNILEQKATDDQGRALLRDFRIEVKQVTVPALGAVDRCVSCHNGIDDPRMAEVKNPHTTHPGDVLTKHPVDRFGCTVCHQGQGAATNFVDAKAEDAFWDYPLLPPALTQSTCVACHDAQYLATKAPEQVRLINTGMRLYQEKSCAACHKIGNRGGTLGPALDDVGAKSKHQFILSHLPLPHTTWRWHMAHFRDPAGIVPGSQMINPNVSETEALALTVYMLSLRQRDVPESYLSADKIEQKARALHPAPLPGEQVYRNYCAACHAPAGQGTNYAALGVRAPGIGQPDFLDVASDRFIESTVVSGRPERKMPAMAAAGATLSAEETKSLVAYLRARAVPPPALAEVERAAADRAVGEQVYRADCAVCHGDTGEGTALGSPLSSPDRRVRSRAEMHRAITQGAPDTAMPRYTRYDPATLRSLLDYTAALPAHNVSRSGWRIGRGDVERGRTVFAKNCAGCHGERGEGKIGPALGSPGFQQAATDEFVAATVARGRAGTPMPAFGRDSVSYSKLTPEEVLDVAAFVRRGLAVKTEKAQRAAPAEKARGGN